MLLEQYDSVQNTTRLHFNPIFCHKGALNVSCYAFNRETFLRQTTQRPPPPEPIGYRGSPLRELIGCGVSPPRADWLKFKRELTALFSRARKLRRTFHASLITAISIKYTSNKRKHIYRCLKVFTLHPKWPISYDISYIYKY